MSNYRYPEYKFKIGDQLFCTVFLKEDPKKFFLCMVLVEKVPEHYKDFYKVRVYKIAESPIGGTQTNQQKKLLNKVISKKNIQMYKNVPFFMEPKKWLER